MVLWSRVHTISSEAGLSFQATSGLDKALYVPLDSGNAFEKIWQQHARLLEDALGEASAVHVGRFVVEANAGSSIEGELTCHPGSGFKSLGCDLLMVYPKARVFSAVRSGGGSSFRRNFDSPWGFPLLFRGFVKKMDFEAGWTGYYSTCNCNIVDLCLS